ncbi:hypothetical protein CPLU01_04935 [Colletotrichum plurivorum]|uniref:Uncharacterized protein n=1 Tax=Colletotrichum plurivorum TaxID=2175906 RepID=A0A8H6NJ28_9PEZI|nr:hypothetical protein CPLU01_04935 [Colletotrichum plurivorum]
MDSVSWYAHPDMMERLETYYDTLLLSVFGNPRFLPVVWAAKPDERTGMNIGDEYLLPCRRSRPAIRYYYRVRILVLVYSIAAFLAILGVIAGTIAVRKNGGISRNTRFSSILAASMAPGLKSVAWDGLQKDRGHVSEESMKQKLGYGLLASRDGDESGGVGHCGVTTR